MKRKITVRIPKIIIFIVIFLFVVIIGRLSYVALSTNIDGINLHEFADNRNTKSDTIYAKRGSIYDKDGNILASVVNSYKIIAYLDSDRTTNPKKPQHVVDIEATAKMLNEMLGIDYNKAIEWLNKDAYQVEFGAKGKNISETLKNKIEALNMPGIDFIPSTMRTYAQSKFASYIIGYAKKNEDTGEIKGELGIEQYYNEELSGTNGKTTYQTDAKGYKLPSAEVITEEAVDGNDIYLTLDTMIQRFSEELVSSLIKDYQMDWMIFSVMDAKTGAIIASSTYPNFDPNKLDITKFMNPLVSYEYEAGSTMKIFSFASAIEEGVYNGSEEYLSGSYKVAGATIKDHNKTGWGKISFDTGFAYSSNVAASILAVEKLKSENLMKYYQNLGFGKKTGIELSNEVSGKINFHYESELATAAFGQGGITVTPIQMLQALSTLTNDGTMLKPYIVDKIVDNKGNTVYSGERTEVRKVFSKETTDYMKKLMHDVVYDGMASSHVWQPSKTTMIGKTGTAQIASPDGGYLTGSYNYLRSFAGIFPEEDPEYIVYIAAKQITSPNAQPLAKALTKAVDDIVSYLGYEKKETDIEEKIVTLNNYFSTLVTTTVEELKNKKVNVITIGSGKYVINQYPLKDSKILEGSKVFILTNDESYKMENIVGWSQNEVRTYANLLGLNLHTTGYGKVISQSIEAGTSIEKGAELTVTLEK